MIRVLLKADVNVNCLQVDGGTTLLLAAQEGYVDAVSTLCLDVVAHGLGRALFPPVGRGVAETSSESGNRADS